MSTKESKNISDIDYSKAVAIQNELKTKVVLEEFICLDKISKIAGCDVSYSKEKNKCYAAIIIFSYPEIEILERSSFSSIAEFPYIPGLLSFRELPPLIKAFNTIKSFPDLIVFDSQGIAHPRRFGLASHAGVLLDIPSIGWAKTRLIGKYDDLGNVKGSYTKLMNENKNEQLGWVIRTKDSCNPMYVSPGHKISFKQCIDFAISNLGKYRIPEITRQPHILSNEIRLLDY